MGLPGRFYANRRHEKLAHIATGFGYREKPLLDGDESPPIDATKSSPT